MKKFVTIFLTVIIICSLACSVLASTGTVNTQGLNLRDGASTSGTNIIVKIDKDEVLNIEEDLGEWYKVNYKDYSGFVNKQYVDLNPEEPVETTIEDGHGRVLSDATNVYVLPLLNSTHLSELKKGQDVIIISEVENWKFIQTENTTGWVVANKIEGTLKKESNQENETNNQTENKANEVVEENNQVTNNVDTNNENTSTEENEEKPQTTTTYPTSLYVNVDAVNIRENATTESNVVASVGLNTPVRVTGEEGDWYKVEVSDGKGYIMKRYLSQEKQ